MVNGLGTHVAVDWCRVRSLYRPRGAVQLSEREESTPRQLGVVYLGSCLGGGPGAMLLLKGDGTGRTGLAGGWVGCRHEGGRAG